MNIPPEYVVNHEYRLENETVRSIGVILYELSHGYSLNYCSMEEVAKHLPVIKKSLSKGKVQFLTVPE